MSGSSPILVGPARESSGDGWSAMSRGDSPAGQSSRRGAGQAHSAALRRPVQQGPMDRAGRAIGTGSPAPPRSEIGRWTQSGLFLYRSTRGSTRRRWPASRSPMSLGTWLGPNRLPWPGARGHRADGLLPPGGRWRGHRWPVSSVPARPVDALGRPRRHPRSDPPGLPYTTSTNPSVLGRKPLRHDRWRTHVHCLPVGGRWPVGWPVRRTSATPPDLPLGPHWPPRVRSAPRPAG